MDDYNFGARTSEAMKNVVVLCKPRNRVCVLKIVFLITF